jgi:hypothetical protein
MIKKRQVQDNRWDDSSRLLGTCFMHILDGFRRRNSPGDVWISLWEYMGPIPPKSPKSAILWQNRGEDPSRLLPLYLGHTNDDIRRRNKL